MRMRSRFRPLLLFVLLSSCIAATAAASLLLPGSESESATKLSLADQDVPAAAAADNAAAAAVDDGQDGKPHHGPFVETTEGGRDGVPSSSSPKSSSKSKLMLNRLAVNPNSFPKVPIAPKEAPPTPPHAEQEMLQAEVDEGDKAKKTGGVGVGVGIGGVGSGSGANIAAITAGLTNPDHLAVVSKTTATAAGPAEPDKPEHPAGPYDPDLGAYDPDRLIQPLHSFILSFTMILFSEVGDKTFLVAALMAMKHDRIVVFTAAGSALLVMTVLSAVLGHTVPLLIPKRLTSFAASGLFFLFGSNLLREGMAMSPDEGITAEMHEVENEIAEKEVVQSAHAREMGVPSRVADPSASRPSRSPSRFPAAAARRSPSPISPREDRAGVGHAASGALQGVTNLFSFLLSPAWVQTFVMTFLAEWGDRSQIATIAMAAGQDYWWVTAGAMCGHAICTGAAVLGGRAVAGRVSLKVVTLGGASAFILFGFIYLLESIYA